MAKKKNELKAKREFMRKSGSEGILKPKKASKKRAASKPKASPTRPAKSPMTLLTEKFERAMGHKPGRSRGRGRR